MRLFMLRNFPSDLSVGQKCCAVVREAVELDKNFSLWSGCSSSLQLFYSIFWVFFALCIQTDTHAREPTRILTIPMGELSWTESVLRKSLSLRLSQDRRRRSPKGCWERAATKLSCAKKLRAHVPMLLWNWDVLATLFSYQTLLRPGYKNKLAVLGNEKEEINNYKQWRREKRRRERKKKAKLGLVSAVLTKYYDFSSPFGSLKSTFECWANSSSTA